MNKYLLFRRVFSPLLFSMLICSILLTGCKDGKDGAPGPKGTQGPQGIQGPKGPKGLDGEQPVKGGYITGTITGFLSDGTPVNEPFNCEFSYNSNPTAFSYSNGYYNFSFNRSDSLSKQYMFMYIRVSEDFSSPIFRVGSFILDKKLNDNTSANLNAWQVFYPYSSNSNETPLSLVPGSTLSNLNFNASTATLTGNFTWNADNSYVSDDAAIYSSSTSSQKNFTISGSFSIPFKQYVYRIGVSGQ